MSCIYDYDSPCECDIEACRTVIKIRTSRNRIAIL